MRLAVCVLLALLSVTGLAEGAGGVGAARPWIGILIETGEKGVRVKQVVDATPAQKAGLQAADEVLSLDGTATKDPADLIQRIQDKGVGEKVTLKILRAGKEQDITLALEARPDDLQLLKSRLLDKPAPAFAPESVAGPHSAKLSDLAGQVVVVEFWATWCGPCTASIPHLNEWHEKFGKKGLRIVGISSEDKATVEKFAREKKLKYTVAADPEGKVGGAYFVPAIPTVVVIDRKGVVRFVGVGGGSNLDDAEAIFTKLLQEK